MHRYFSGMNSGQNVLLKLSGILIIAYDIFSDFFRACL